MKINKLVELWRSKGMIVEGITNSIFKRDEIEEVANYRLAICKSNKCKSYDTTGKGCYLSGTQPCCNKLNGGCGCSLTFSTRSMSKKCPKGYWDSIITEEEEDQLKQQLL